MARGWSPWAAELSAGSALVARLPNPEINLAAHGGVVFQVALAIESPIVMLLAASTALCRDWASYCKAFRYMLLVGAVLMALQVLDASTSPFAAGRPGRQCGHAMLKPDSLFSYGAAGGLRNHDATPFLREEHLWGP